MKEVAEMFPFSTDMCPQMNLSVSSKALIVWRLGEIQQTPYPSILGIKIVEISEAAAS